MIQNQKKTEKIKSNNKSGKVTDDFFVTAMKS